MSAQKFIPITVGTLLLVAAALTLTSGITSDQISYKIVLERYFIAGGFRQTLMPYCADGFLVAPPLILIPAAALWAQLTRLGSGTFSYHLIPFVSLTIVLLILIHHNLRKNSRDFWPLLLYVTLGTMPFAITWLRPEAIILASGITLFFIGTRMLVERRSLYLYLYGFAEVIVYSVVVYVHPKSVYLIVVPVISVLFSGMNIPSPAQRTVYRTIFITGFSLLTYSVISLFQKQTLTCQVPQVQNMLNTYSTNPLDLFFNPVRFISNLRMALGAHAPVRTISLLLYRAGLDADFLPLKSTTTLADLVADLFIALAVAGLATYVVMKFFVCMLRAKNPAERREFHLIAALLAALTIPFALSVIKQAYEVALFHWTLMIAAVLLWPLSPGLRGDYQRLRTGAFATLVALSLACVFLSYNNFVRPWLDGYGGGVPYFVDMPTLDRGIGEMLTEAHIGPKEPLIVSDLTYEAAKYHPYVVPLTYMRWGYSVPGATRAYMKRFGIHYGVIECYLFKPEKEFQAQLMMSRRFTQARDGRASAGYDVCLFRLNYAGAT